MLSAAWDVSLPDPGREIWGETCADPAMSTCMLGCPGGYRLALLQNEPKLHGYSLQRSGLGEHGVAPARMVGCSRELTIRCWILTVKCNIAHGF